MRCCWVLPLLTSTLLLASPSRAANEGVALELNKFEQHDAACRVYMVFANGTPESLSSYKADLVFFDATGVIVSRIVVDGAPLPAGKTRVKLFDVPATSCGDIGHVLLNDVAACETDAGSLGNCVGRTSTSSRQAVDLIK